MKTLITQSALRQILEYEPTTGAFRWRTNVYGRGGARIGDRAGFLHDNGYWRINLRGRFYYAHRLAWLYVYGELPTAGLDHINRIRSDNRIENLRIATRNQNGANVEATCARSGLRGANWDAARCKWISRIMINGVVHHIGRFDTKEQAADAYRLARKKHFGEFAP